MSDDLNGFLGSSQQETRRLCLLTMLTFRTDQPSRCGIVMTDERGVVTSFRRKGA